MSSDLFDPFLENVSYYILIYKYYCIVMYSILSLLKPTNPPTPEPTPPPTEIVVTPQVSFFLVSLDFVQVQCFGHSLLLATHAHTQMFV